MKLRGLAFLATALAGGLLFPWTAGAQEAPPPSPTPKPAVKFQFLPPPMEGTISMGIFDSTGKLVRSLHREAEVESSAFIKEINGLITFWDGKDDAGNPMPAGKYSARGFMVGDLQIEGEAFLCNDWVVDEKSPRIRRITDIGPISAKVPAARVAGDEPVGAPSDRITLTVELADGKTAHPGCDVSGTLWPSSDPSSQRAGPSAILAHGLVALPGGEGGGAIPSVELPISGTGTHVAVAAGRDNSLWVIDRAQDGNTEVKQYSLKGEFLRRLAIDPTQPLPTKISASKTADAICLLEENSQCQRFRWLELLNTDAGSDKPVSTWKEVLKKTITFSDQFSQVQAELKMPGGKAVAGQPKLRVQLVPNPLLQDKATPLEISLGIDAEGSFFKTADGLLLKRITDTPGLKWAVMDREPGSSVVVVFQSDGAVVEEFRVGKVGNMMAFDYGEFQLNPAK